MTGPTSESEPQPGPSAGTGPLHHTTIAELFEPDPKDVAEMVAATLGDHSTELALPSQPPTAGLGAETALSLVTPYVRGAARQLGDPGFLAHMDPPTPWVAWVMTLLSASTNQNLLHPDTAPAARALEETVVGWLAERFAMTGGHLVPGSTVANLSALWAARERTGATTVVASSDSHLSIRKAAAILGLDYASIPGAVDKASLTTAFAASDPAIDANKTIVVATAGTTGTGAIDQLDLSALANRPAWIHVDAAWAGPLQLSDRYRRRLAGIEAADSISVSAHKWLYQPKESALVLFADAESAHAAISVDGAYLQVPNVGVLGSHGAAAAPLAATILTLGLDGLAALIDAGMATADRLLERIEAEPDLMAWGENVSGVVAWRHCRCDAVALRAELSDAFVSTVSIDGVTWLRSVAANPMADPDLVVDAVLAAADRVAAG